MRLAEVERGDSPKHRLLIRTISAASRMRLPDAARVAFYDQQFAGRALGAWAQATMRGPSSWTVSERELMAATVATWNSCPFCVGAHGAVAVRGIPQQTVDATLTDYRSAPISERLRGAFTFLETMVKHPDVLGVDHAEAALRAGLTKQDLRDAAAVGALFSIITRYANALDFEIPTHDEFTKSAVMLLRRGYG
jgi:uncharacterized peroxidase-related enzyme